MYIWFTHTVVYDYDDCLIAILVQCYPVEGESESVFERVAGAGLRSRECTLCVWLPGPALELVLRRIQSRLGQALLVRQKLP
jgi:hypothetical protein